MTNDTNNRKTASETTAGRLKKLGPEEWHDVAQKLIEEPWGEEAVRLGRNAFDRALKETEERT